MPLCTWFEQNEFTRERTIESEDEFRQWVKVKRIEPDTILRLTTGHWTLAGNYFVWSRESDPSKYTLESIKTSWREKTLSETEPLLWAGHLFFAKDIILRILDAERKIRDWQKKTADEPGSSAGPTVPSQPLAESVPHKNGAGPPSPGPVVTPLAGPVSPPPSRPLREVIPTKVKVDSRETIRVEDADPETGLRSTNSSTATMVDPDALANLPMGAIEAIRAVRDAGLRSGDDRPPTTIYVLMGLTLLAVLGSLGLQVWREAKLADQGITAESTSGTELPLTVTPSVSGPLPDDLHVLRKDLSAQIEATRQSLDTRIKAAETSREKIRTDLATVKLDLQRTVMESRQAINEQVHATLKSEPTAVRTRLDSLENRLRQFEEGFLTRAAGLDGRLEQLANGLHVPAENELVPVCFVLDGGQRMNEYSYDAVRGALTQALQSAIRHTPTRPVGLLFNRGEQPQKLIPLQRHPLVDLARFFAIVNSAVATPGEDSSWTRGLDAGLETPSGKTSPVLRVVLVTCAPKLARPEPENLWKDLKRKADQNRAEIWVVQLLHADEAPVAPLATLALSTGGQYLTLQAGPNSPLTSDVLAARITAHFHHALQLPPPVQN